MALVARSQASPRLSHADQPRLAEEQTGGAAPRTSPAAAAAPLQRATHKVHFGKREACGALEQVQAQVNMEIPPHAKEGKVWRPLKPAWRRSRGGARHTGAAAVTLLSGGDRGRSSSTAADLNVTRRLKILLETGIKSKIQPC